MLSKAVLRTTRVWGPQGESPPVTRRSGNDQDPEVGELYETEIVDRDTVADYLPIHGNENGCGRGWKESGKLRSTVGNRVFEALIRNEITDEDLDRAGVPRQWVL